MHNCECVIQYDYDEQAGDSPDQRSNHQIISPCPFHPDLNAVELYEELINEMAQVAACNQKIGELHPELLKVTDSETGDKGLDEAKVMVGFDEKRDLVASVVGLDTAKMENLKTELEAITDRAVEVI